MGRIRTIKPEFFRHEQLQELEAANPGQHPMLVFAGLFTAVDRAGRFEWRPRSLKLDILPFLDFDLATTLAILQAAGLVQQYVVDGRTYGLINSFERHQRIDGKERAAPCRYPPPPAPSVPTTPPEHTRTTPGPHPAGQEKEKEKEKENEKEKEKENENDTSPPPLDSGMRVSAAAPTMAAAVCVTLKALGIPDVNPGHPTLSALIEAGADVGTFAGAARNAVLKEKGKFAYVLATVKNQMSELQIQAKTAVSTNGTGRTESPRDRQARQQMQAWAPGIAAADPTQPTQAINDIATDVTGYEQKGALCVTQHRNH